MKISVKINSPIQKKGYPPARQYAASDLSNLVKIGASLYGEKTYLRFKRNRQDTQVSYKDFDQMVDCVGSAFAELGVGESPIAVIGESSPEWVVTYLAAANGGGMIVPLDRELAEEQIANFIRRAHVRYIVHSASFTEMFHRLADELPDVVGFAEISKEYFPYPDQTGSTQPITERFVPFEALVRRGTGLLNTGYHIYTSHKIDLDKPAVLLYTSGTTGTSKGVLLSQRNVTTAVNTSYSMIDVYKEDTLLSVLPIHHTYEMTCGYLTPLLVGATICINENLKTVVRNLQEYKPTIMVLVPLFITTFHKKIMESVRKKGLEKKIKLAMAASNMARHVGVDMRETLFKEIHETFGGRLDRIVCGGAPMNPDMGKFFDAIGIKLTQGYGITECAPLISVSPFHCIKAASVGLPVPGLEVRIGGEDGTLLENPPAGTIGEIVVRGDNVMLGYQDDPEATAAVLDEEGWFRTGDIGYMDREGYIYITGRAKNVIVLHNGKNVFPEEIEEYIEKIDLVSECAVIGRTAMDGETVNVTAVIYPDFTRAEELGLDGIDAISDELRKRINKININLPMFKQIRGVEVRKTPFVKTTSKKIIRYRIDEE